MFAFLFLVAAPAAPPSETDLVKARAAFAFAVAAAEAREVIPVPAQMPAKVTSGVVTQPRPFTDIGRAIVVPPPAVPAPNTALPVGTVTELIPTYATYAGRRGSTVRCVSYG